MEFVYHVARHTKIWSLPISCWAKKTETLDPVFHWGFQSEELLWGDLRFCQRFSVPKGLGNMDTSNSIEMCL